MNISKQLRKWKANLTTQMPVEYVLTLRADVKGFADEVKVLESENEKLRADAAHWELEHCPACKNIADLQEALDENARLRKAMDFQALELGCMTDNRDVLHVENARLRQLVDAWMGCGTRYHTMQGGCPMFDADAENFCKATRLARELGIEVDE